MSLPYQEYGDKDASLMVFLHGGGVSSWMWDKQIQYFSHYHCVAIDLPGHGTNDNHIGKFPIKLSAEVALVQCVTLGFEIQAFYGLVELFCV